MNCHDAMQATQRHAEESASAAQQIRALQQQLAEEQSAKETEQQVRERAEQQVAELKVHACSSLQSSSDHISCAGALTHSTGAAHIEGLSMHRRDANKGKIRLWRYTSLMDCFWAACLWARQLGSELEVPS